MKMIDWKWLPENLAEATELLEKLEFSIAKLEKYLPYADHGAYGQDKRRITDNKQMIVRIKQMIKENNYV